MIFLAFFGKRKFRIDWTFELGRSLRENARKKDIQGKRQLKSLGHIRRKEGLENVMDRMNERQKKTLMILNTWLREDSEDRKKTKKN